MLTIIILKVSIGLRKQDAFIKQDIRQRCVFVLLLFFLFVNLYTQVLDKIYTLVI